MINIVAVKTNKGLFITRNDGNYNGRTISGYLFDGEKPEPSFHQDWFIINQEPARVSHTQKQSDINHRYVLTDDTLSNKLPTELPIDEAGEYIKDCEGQHFVWKDEYAMYKSLYILVSDSQPDLDVEDEFSFQIAFQVDEVKPPKEINYPVNERRVSYKDEKIIDHITNKNTEHQLLDKMVFPTILLADTPCRLSSEESYKIIRWHIKQNIDYKVAKITSDYDFCFTVVKVIQLAEPYTATYERTLRGRRKPTISNRFVSTREVPIFEMTHAASNYKGYTTIQGFEADDENKLKQQIDNYLKDLMGKINEPLKDCPHCKGKGVVVLGVKE